MSVFDWDEANILHIAEHGVTPMEAEEALLGTPLQLDSYVVHGEQRFEEAGETASGRILKVITTARGEKVRVVTAFDASAYTGRIYLRSRMDV